MSEKNKKTLCPSCGAEVPVNESKSLKKICNILRGVLEDDPADWEEQESEPEVPADPEEVIQDVSVVATKPTMTLADRIKKLLSHKVFNRIVVMVLAVAMLALAFAPLVSYRIYEDEVAYEMAYSGVDNVTMTATSAYLLGEQAQPTAATEEITSADALARQTLLTAARVKMGMSLSAVLATLCYAVYLLLCLLLVIFAFKNLISEFFAAKKNRTRLRKYASDGILCFLLCFFPLLAFLMKQACDVAVANAVLFDGRIFGGTALSWAAIASFAVALVGTIFVCLTHSFGALRLHGRYFDRSRIKHLLSVVLVIALLCSLFLPLVQIKIWDPDTGREQTASVALWELREVTRNERVIYQKSGVTANVAYDALVEQGGELPEGTGKEFVHTLFLTSNMSAIRMLYTVVEVLTVLILFFAGLLLWSLLRRGFFGAKRLRMVNFFKLLTLITVIVSLVMAMIIPQVLASVLPSALIYSLDFKIGAGILMMSVCAFLTVVLKLSAKKEVKYVDEDYDNADVSYAPYVFGKKN